MGLENCSFFLPLQGKDISTTGPLWGEHKEQSRPNGPSTQLREKYGGVPAHSGKSWSAPFIPSEVVVPVGWNFSREPSRSGTVGTWLTLDLSDYAFRFSRALH